MSRVQQAVSRSDVTGRVAQRREHELLHLQTCSSDSTFTLTRQLDSFHPLQRIVLEDQMLQRRQVYPQHDPLHSLVSVSDCRSDKQP